MRGRPKKIENLINDELRDPEKRRIVYTMLQEGSKSDFWIYITKMLEINKEALKSYLMNHDFKDLAEVNETQIKIEYIEKLIKIPEKMMREADLLEENAKNKVSLDPYE